MIRCPAGDIVCSRCCRKLAEVKWRLGTSVRRSGREAALGGGRTPLPAGHTIDLVVHTDHGDIDIAPAGMDEVVAADGRKVPVAGEDDHMQVRVCHLDTGGKRQCPSMGGVKRIGEDVPWSTGGAADAGDKDRILLLPAHLVDGCKGTVDDRPVPAASTVDVREPVLAEPVLETHGSASRAAASSFGVWSSPPSFGMLFTGTFTCRWISRAIWPRFISGTRKHRAFLNS